MRVRLKRRQPPSPSPELPGSRPRSSSHARPAFRWPRIPTTVISDAQASFADDTSTGSRSLWLIPRPRASTCTRRRRRYPGGRGRHRRRVSRARGSAVEEGDRAQSDGLPSERGRRPGRRHPQRDGGASRPGVDLTFDRESLGLPGREPADGLVVSLGTACSSSSDGDGSLRELYAIRPEHRPVPDTLLEPDSCTLGWRRRPR